jgi:deoxyadenosine/deoxycytidine kinase
MNYRYIAIEGNIGAGKTTLARRFAEDLSAKLVIEEFAGNTFLAKFYDNPGRYAFPLELSFLAERFSQLSREVAMPELFGQPVVSDYFINKSQVFARNNLVDDEYELFVKLFSMMQLQVPKPDLIIYLHMSVPNLLINIKKRGREYEKKIPAKYLENIQKRYMELLKMHEGLKIVVADTNGIDFVGNEGHYEKVKSLLYTDIPSGITRIQL